MSRYRVGHAANATVQNKINVSVVFNYLRTAGPSYRAEIARALHLSIPAVTRAVEVLREQQYVVETERLTTKHKKKAVHYLANKRHGYIISVDLVKQRTRVAVANFAGHILDRYQGFSPATSSNVPRDLVAEIRKTLSYCAEDNALENQRLIAIGIGVPAIVDSERGLVTNAPLYDNLEGLNLSESVSAVFGVPTFVENVVKLSALGEIECGVGKRYQSMVFVEVSNGIGAGIVLDNQILRGRRGAAGEIGFSRPFLRGLAASAGGDTGTLEEAASIQALTTWGMRAVESGTNRYLAELSGGSSANVSAETVCRAALAGDAASREAIEKVDSTIAYAVLNLILTLDPEVVVVGGDVCTLPDPDTLFLKPIVERVESSAPFPIPPIVLSSLGEDAGICGAAHYSIESILSQRFPYALGE